MLYGEPSTQRNVVTLGLPLRWCKAVMCCVCCVCCVVLCCVVCVVLCCVVCVVCVVWCGVGWGVGVGVVWCGGVVVWWCGVWCCVVCCCCCCYGWVDGGWLGRVSTTHHCTHYVHTRAQGDTAVSSLCFVFSLSVPVLISMWCSVQL